MQHNIILPGEGFKPRTSKGGSVKGAPKLKWTIGVKALYKIGMQRIMETCNPGLVITRKFNGQYGPEALFLFAEKHDPEVILDLRYSGLPMYPERSYTQMLGLLYDRGHKGFYWNEGEAHTVERARHSGEHYSNSIHLRHRVTEAETKFRSLLHLTKK